jgi:predicted metal-dependent phosphoesterase TrpH
MFPPLSSPARPVPHTRGVTARRIRLDMHLHTEHSVDSDATVADQLAALASAGIDVVCVTDHNTIAGAQRMREAAGDGLRVIVGEEISTRDGELLGLFLDRPVPAELSCEEAIALVHEQGGIVSVPHPFSRNRPRHLRRDALDRVWPQIDCLEIFNAREISAAENQRAAAYARERNIPGAAGSDAHRASDVGRAWIEIDDFTAPEDLLEALRTGAVHGRLAPSENPLAALVRRLR